MHLIATARRMGIPELLTVDNLTIRLAVTMPPAASHQPLHHPCPGGDAAASASDCLLLISDTSERSLLQNTPIITCGY